MGGAVRRLAVPALGRLVLAGMPAARSDAGPGQPSEARATAAELADFRRAFATILATGAYPALAHVNARTRFRFTALYRVDGSRFRGVCLYDRENPTLRCALPPCAPAACYSAAKSVARAPRAASRRTSLALPGEDDIGMGDRNAGGCRTAVALPLSRWELAGVLLHTDPRPRILLLGERERLATIASLLARWLATFPRGAAVD